jgi:hypothetical protein
MVHVMSEVKKYNAYAEGLTVHFELDSEGAWVAASDFDAQRLRADTAEAERDALKDDVMSLSSIVEECWRERAAAEQRIADRDALLRSTSAQLWKAHIALNRLIELEPAHKVKLLTDTINTLAYAHKCIDLPHWDAALNPNPEAESHEL